MMQAQCEFVILRSMMIGENQFCINLIHQKAENIYYLELVAQIKTFAHYEEDGKTLVKHSNYKLFVEQLASNGLLHSGSTQQNPPFKLLVVIGRILTQGNLNVSSGSSELSIAN